jgi:mannosyltransferase OCH1-like enzyme
VPSAWLESTLSLQQSLLGSDWQYIFITDSELFVFVHQKFPHLLKSMAALPYGVQRADVLRYLWLYVYGGIYIDMDYKIKKSFIKYIEDLQVPLCVLHSANVSLCITNSFIVAKPGLRFFYDLACRALGEPYGSWWAFSKHIEIMTSSGPMAFHSAVTQSGLSYVILPNELFLPSSPEIDEPENVKETDAFMIPVKGASWNSLDSQLLNIVNMNKKTLLLWFGLIIIFKILDYWHLWRLRESLRNIKVLSNYI